MASLNPELITQIGGFPVTNTVITTVIVDILLIVFLYFAAKNIRIIPNKFQNAVESLLSYFYDLAKNMTGTRAKTIFPWVMTFFIFIVVSNFLGLVPGVGSIGIREPASHIEEEATNTHTEMPEPPTETIHTVGESNAEPITDTHTQDPSHEQSTAPSNNNEASDTHVKETTQEEHAASKEAHPEHIVSFLRPATSDFNTTFALAVISLTVTHILSIRFTGLKDYISRFISFNPIMLFVGLLELVSEFIKIFSLSFRLFGNIYAGEVVLATISGLFAFLAPLPFLLLESIVAIVQALVFAMLTLVFMSVLTEKHHADEH